MLGAEMSAANQQSGPHGARRAAVTGVVVVLVVLAAGLVLLALQPRTTTATATLTVTPRTEAGADAALLLADRYTALAGSAEVLGAAQADEPALAEVSLTELQEGVEVERPPGTATVVVQVTLPDPDAAVTAANAVVGRLVEAGADEELVAVDPGREASPARTTGSSATARWVVVSVLLALAAGLCAALGSTLLTRGRTAGRATGSADAEALDDLPGFLVDPPGSPAPVPPRTGRTGATAAPVGSPGGAVSRTTGSAVTLTAALLLVLAAVAVGAPIGRAGSNSLSAAPATGIAPAAPAPDSTAPDSTAPGLDPAVPSAPAAETGAGALTFRSVPLGTDGIAATASFGGVLLEERAVGLTVTYPDVSVTTDGRRALAHVRLPTYNCLTTEPPADPVAAGCVRSVTEYADLASPELQVTRDGDRIELAGLFPTYTRPNGSAPSYTGRAYQLAASIAPDGPRRDDTTPATGVVRIGLDSAATAPERGVSRLQHPG
jgi:capsular polysaccharide biosynthesis protein